MCDKCNGNCNSCNCTCQEPCLTPDCACKVFITTDCVTLSEDLTCSNIANGQTTTEVLKQLDAYICERFQSVENFLQIVNVGGGAGIYKGISVLGKKELKSLISDGTITITPGTDTINFSVNFPPEINQDNFVRQLIIDINDLPSSDYFIGDLIDYILALPEAQRTILETDSKWNIITAFPAEGGYLVSQIYELQNKGKGIITELENSNFLLITKKDVSWNDTLRVNSNLIDGINTQVAQSWGVFSNQGVGTSNGFYLKDISLTAPDIPIFILGAGMGQTDIERSLSYYTDRTEFTDGQNLRGIEYNGNYEANFLPRTLITKQYADNLFASIDGSETKINAGTNISITGIGTTGNPYIINNPGTQITAGSNISITGDGSISTPYIINSTGGDGSETKIIDGIGTTVSGNGTIATPYQINIPKNNIINTGYFETLNIGTSNPLSVSGDIVSASTTLAVTPDHIVLITVVNSLPANYKVDISLESLSSDINDDNDIAMPVYKKVNSTQFSLGFRELSNNTQALRVHIDVKAY